MSELVKSGALAHARLRETYRRLAAAHDRLGSAAHCAGPLDDRQRRLVKLALAIGARSGATVGAHALGAFELGISKQALEQVALLCWTTLGAPVAVAGYSWITEAISERCEMEAGSLGSGSTPSVAENENAQKETPMADLTGSYARIREEFPEVAAAHDRLGEAVHRAGPLDDKARRLIKLALAIGAGSQATVQAQTRKALEAGITDEELGHVALLAWTTLGVPAAVAGYSWITEVLDARRGRGGESFADSDASCKR